MTPASDSIQWCILKNSLHCFRSVVEEANRLGPQYARVFKETILVASPAKPLPRASKGTVLRKMALSVYAYEIENLSVAGLLLPIANLLNAVRLLLDIERSRSA